MANNGNGGNSGKNSAATATAPISLDEALARAGGATRALRETAAQALAIEEAATRLAAGGNEQAAAGERIRGVGGVAGGRDRGDGDRGRRRWRAPRRTSRRRRRSVQQGQESTGSRPARARLVGRRR